MKQITQNEVDTIIHSGKKDKCDLSSNIEIESDYRIEDMEFGDVIIITIQLLNGDITRKECQIIDAQELLLLSEDDDEIQLRYDDDDGKYFIVLA